jgi:hypothetical protein
MRRGLFIASFLCIAGVATAQEEGDEGEKKPKDQKAAGDKKDADAKDAEGEGEGDKKGGMMDSTAPDPAATERYDATGEFSPKGATGDKRTQKEGKADDEEEAEEALAVKPTKGVFGEALIGWGGARFPGPGIPLQEGNVYAFQLGGHWDFSTKVRAMLRVPITTARLEDQPNPGETNNSAALGNPELLGRFLLHEPRRLQWALRVGIGMPLAQGTADVTGEVTDRSGYLRGHVQNLAATAGGFHDRELYVTGRIPVTPALLLSYRRKALSLEGEAKVMVAPKISGDIEVPDDPDGAGTYEMNPVALTALLGGGVDYEFFKPLSGGLRLWTVWDAIREVDFEGTAGGPSPFGLFVEPRVMARFGAITPSLGLVVPVAGTELVGEMLALRIRVDAEF